MGRIIRVQFAKRFKKPVRPAPVIVPPPGETRHRVYVSNLAWKVRSNNLRELFSSNFNPVSARVIFDSHPSGRSAGYGFVSFATKEEAESAINELDGKVINHCYLKAHLILLIFNFSDNISVSTTLIALKDFKLVVSTYVTEFNEVLWLSHKILF